MLLLYHFNFQVNTERHAYLRINDTAQASQIQCNEKEGIRKWEALGQFYLYI